MKRLHVVRTALQRARNPRAPDGFDLTAEQARGGGIVAREYVEEIDQPVRVDEDGAALHDDDDLITDPGTQVPSDL